METGVPSFGIRGDDNIPRRRMACAVVVVELLDAVYKGAGALLVAVLVSPGLDLLEHLSRILGLAELSRSSSAG